jgi:hypothetical protein
VLPRERSRRRRNQYHQVWRLIERGFRTAERDAEREFDGVRTELAVKKRRPVKRTKERTRASA